MALMPQAPWRTVRGRLLMAALLVELLMLGLLVTPHELIKFLVPGVAVAVFLMVVGRPLAALVCLLPFGYTPKEIAFVGWVGLRGAVGVYLASIPVLAGVSNAGVFFNVGFFVVLPLAIWGVIWLLWSLPKWMRESRPVGEAWNPVPSRDAR